jgi:hypothetical protein
MSAVESVILERNEKVIDSWKGQRAVFEEIERKACNERKLKSKEWKKGYLVLTNRRLLFLDEEPVIGQTASVSLKKLAEVFRDETPTKINSPVNGETFVFRLKNVRKKEFEKFKELVLYYAQNDDPSLSQGQPKVNMTVG